MKKQIDLNSVADDELLATRVCNLPIQIKGTWLEDCINLLYDELGQKGLVFRPECYLADEWLTPEKETCIGIPFFLAHPTLIRLEKKFMLEAEGESREWCMKLLRHEAGHAISYAYRFYKRRKWQRIFGPSDTEYGDTYKYRPYSKNYVRHLEGFYAQYHPDEDFVETFAVWLTPGLDWQKKYAKWKAIDKLYYVDRLMQEIKDKPPVVKSSEKYYRLSTLRMTLGNYYKRKRQFLAEEFPDFHDPFLRRNFNEANEENKSAPTISEVIRKHQKNLVSKISRNTGERKYIISEVLKGIQKRGHQLRLVSVQEETVAVLSLASYVSTLVMNYTYTGHFLGERKAVK